MRNVIIVLAVYGLIAGCQAHQPLDKSSTNPECAGYSDGYTVKC